MVVGEVSLDGTNYNTAEKSTIELRCGQTIQIQQPHLTIICVKNHPKKGTTCSILMLIHEANIFMKQIYESPRHNNWKLTDPYTHQPYSYFRSRGAIILPVRQSVHLSLPSTTIIHSLNSGNQRLSHRQCLHLQLLSVDSPMRCQITPDRCSTSPSKLECQYGFPRHSYSP